MFKDLVKFYEIGKELGLNKTEISRVFLSEGKHSGLYQLLRILAYVAIGIFIVIAIIFIASSLYPSGALYSTVKVNDFKKKK